MNNAICRIILISVYLFAGASVAVAGGTADISRAYGPFELGMSEAAFSKLTGITPNSCPICLDNEHFVALSEHQMQRHGVDEPNKNGVDFFFFNDALYLISRTPNTESLFTLREDISVDFGQADNQTTQNNKISALVWSDKITEISINYSANDNEIFSLNIRDKAIGEKRDTLEANMLEQMLSTR